MLLEFKIKAVLTMKISISGRQMTVRDSLRTLLDQKLAKFDKFFGENAEAYVTCSCKNDLKTVEITIHYNGTVFRSEEGSSSFQSAVVRAVDTLEGQMRKNKTRIEKRIREGAFAASDDADVDLYEEEEEQFNIRVKSFTEKPMDPQEAILQMNLSGHSFYAFLDAESGKHAVVYRRKNGDYGLLLPE